ncbi:winged helix-turn-helix transcriptional regulator [Actinosynnema sp. NPDC053489]|uniref:winged helix-turn-helix transcriptional regulator n=1 Tax=Actinosynnema sp. NPDC053489 TaxID=3363916 RepID=UPI0037C79DD7
MRQVRVRVREKIDDVADFCNVEVAFAVVGGKWKMLIVKYLLPGPLRFGELRRAMPSVTQRMLTRQLRELEEDGLVHRTVHAEVPPRTEYGLTALGHSLEPIVEGLDEWGRRYRDEAATAEPRATR